ncbi:MAG: hypothetical protein KGV44_05200 [Flavobacteriaceae bacterium]|nr:hypothetical protein [Flavobacteriaceae bacterium]
MKYFLTAFVAVAMLISCHKKVETEPKPVVKPKPPVKAEINKVSQFAYDGLALYYKWADEMKNKEPNASDNDPKKYFKTLLSEPDTNHGWSWITDDVEGLLNNFGGKSLSFGYKLKFMYIKKEKKIYAIIRYVFKDTPASEANLKSADLIGEVNGKPITANSEGYIDKVSLDALFGNNTTKFTIYKSKSGTIVKDREETISPREIGTNPVVKDTIYNIDGKKIGYLHYTNFIYNYNNELYKAFSKFKKANVTDLILDLRYNTGGAINSATYLASMIAPRAEVENKSTFTELNYNTTINNLFEERGWSRRSKLGIYNTEKESNPIDVNLDLNKVYYIGTSGSYSASELTPHCLRAFMEVVHIGNKTGGKYTASWTITPYRPFKNEKGQATVNTIYDEGKLSAEGKKELKNWAMQPIVAIYGDKNGKDFSKNDGLIPEPENTLKEDLHAFKAPWDTKDVLVGQALYLITGKEEYRPKKASARGYQSYKEIYRKMLPIEKIYSESVILDNVQFPMNELQNELKNRGE